MKKKKVQHAALLLATACIALTGSVQASSPDHFAAAASAPVMYTLTINGAAATMGGYQEGSHIMLPLREAAEALGFEIAWDADEYAAKLTKPDTPLWTLVQMGKDQYVKGETNVALGAAPVLKNSKLYVPSIFFQEVLQASVTIEDREVQIASKSDVKTAVTYGVVTRVNNGDSYKSVHINGVGTEGIVLNVGEDTVIYNADESPISLEKLPVGASIRSVHSLAMTMSLPGQTFAFEIKMLAPVEEKELFGTAGTISEEITTDGGNTRIVVKGERITEHSPDEVILIISEQTIIVDLEDKPVAVTELKPDSKLLAFYPPALAKSLPPIGQAWKIVHIDAK